ncbi:MAG: Hsp70 family protein [Candidatus Riflebacteria bacterium]|nr:Hsp70 family protein [Candidatus Riflebacteria bacterium]
MAGEQVLVLGPSGKQILPSVVGLSPSGELLVGQAARNQWMLYPERTVKSIKRKMGSSERVSLGERTFLPQEISAVILKELASMAGRQLGVAVERAVITVPAYFSDAQRNATREAGELAGLEVVRILNEPTAASLAYGTEGPSRRTVMVYDLGGGTFDVSIVTMEADVTEVLASHGNNHLGGDDFDQLIVNRLLQVFREAHQVDLQEPQYRQGLARLWWAAEEAKKTLSAEPYARIREEALAVLEGKPLNLDYELSADEYEAMIRPLVESTLESVSKALADAAKRPSDLDAIFLVGGSTRTPMVSRLLEERCAMTPRQEVHPDLCVALGAGVLASRLGGHAIERVLVDVSPYSFGPSYLGMLGGMPYHHCYHPVIHRNTPLPVTRTERYSTAAPFQREVDVEIFQGEDGDALKNVPVGHFRISGLTPKKDANEVLCRMALDLDGILRVTAIEKETGLSKEILIDNALAARSPEEVAKARRELESLYSTRTEGDAFAQAEAFEEGEDAQGREAEKPEAERESVPAAGSGAKAPADAWSVSVTEARALIERARGLLPKIHEEDREEMIDLLESMDDAIVTADAGSLATARRELQELLFFVEGK